MSTKGEAMSASALTNLLIGMARDYKKEERIVQERLEYLATVPLGSISPDIRSVRYQHRSDFKRVLHDTLLRDGYFMAQDIDRLVGAIDLLFDNSDPTYKPKNPASRVQKPRVPTCAPRFRAKWKTP